MSYTRSTCLFVLGALVASSVVAAVPCGPGTYTTGPGMCFYCSPGYYNDQPTPAANCKQAQAGYKACGDKTSFDGTGSGTCYGATQQQACGRGNYQPTAGSSTCLVCPRGSFCQNEATENPQKCSPGYYMPNEGWGESYCWGCPGGQFNNVYGAYACCNCCAGTFTMGGPHTHCFSCWEHTNSPKRAYSNPGSDSVDDCQENPIPGVTNAPECKDTMAQEPGQAFCPPEQGNTPAGPSPINKRRSVRRCSPGYKSCPRFYGQGGFDCVDTRSDPENCGGCVDPDGIDSTLTGTDCTAIQDVNVVRCVRSKCLIDSCRKGYTKSIDGKSCVPAGNANLTNQAHRRQARKWNHHGLSRSDTL